MTSPLTGRHFVLDGSNLTFFHGIHYPELRYVLAVEDYLLRQGASCHSYFDANLLYALEAGRPEDAEVFQALLSDQHAGHRLSVVPSGTPADVVILADAKARQAEVISNDKFRDRAKGNRWIWKRRHGFIRLGDALGIASLHARIPLRQHAIDYRPIQRVAPDTWLGADQQFGARSG